MMMAVVVVMVIIIIIIMMMMMIKDALDLESSRKLKSNNFLEFKSEIQWFAL